MLVQTYSVLKIMAVSIYFPGVQFIFRINVIKYLLSSFSDNGKIGYKTGSLSVPDCISSTHIQDMSFSS